MDPGLPLPFANLVLPHGPRKRHGFAGVKAPKEEQIAPSPVRVQVPPPPSGGGSALPIGQAADGVRLTQNVTAGDVMRGALRVPRSSPDIFPTGKTTIWVYLGSERYEADWNPHVGPDRERSGTIRLGRSRLEGRGLVGGPRRIISAGDGFRIE